MTDALHREQQEILEKRGVLSPEEIHRLAGKTRRAMGGARGARAACHSELTSDDEAARAAGGRLDPVTLAPLSE